MPILITSDDYDVSTWGVHQVSTRWTVWVSTWGVHPNQDFFAKLNRCLDQAWDRCPPEVSTRNLNLTLFFNPLSSVHLGVTVHPFFNLWLAWRHGPNDPRFNLPGRNRKIIAKRAQQARRVAFWRYL